MTYTTKFSTVYGERYEFLENIAAFPRHRITGDIMTEQGMLDRRASMLVRVTPDGRAWADDPSDMMPAGYALTVERWGDMERIGATFSPDNGELERCGIIPVLCGSAAQF